MTYLPALRSSLVHAAHRQHQVSLATDERERASRTARRRRTMHRGRAVLASVVLGLSGTAVGAIHVGAPLGPELPLSRSITKPVTAPGAVAPYRLGEPPQKTTQSPSSVPAS